jgi:hypothetical protein
MPIEDHPDDAGVQSERLPATSAGYSSDAEGGEKAKLKGLIAGWWSGL